MSESEIIQKLQQGDEQAFRVLVDTYRKLVVNTCFAILHHLEDAEDVAQDVFIEVFRSVQKFRADSKISTWLYRIAVNRSLNFMRDHKYKKRIQSLDEPKHNENSQIYNLRAGGSDQPGYIIEDRQRAALLHAAIDSLADNQKVAFTLNKYEDLSYQEISEIMDLSLSSVESLIHRAKKNLQKKLYDCYKKRCL
jgi:RNA polymerase sigma-70 factor, ECF subfamily